MNSASDPVLELLREYEDEFPIPKSIMDKVLDQSRRTIVRAVDDLEDRGFIERDEDYKSHYWITDRGRKYLDGEIDANDY